MITRRAVWPAPSVGRRLTWAFAVLPVLLFTGALSVVVAVWFTWHDLAALTDHDYPLLDANAEALQALTDAQTAERGYLISADPTFLERYQPGVDKFEHRLSTMVARAEDDELTALFRAQHEAGRRWVDEFGDPTIALAARDLAGAREESASGRGRTLFDDVRRTNTQARAELHQRVAARESGTRGTILGSLGAVVVLAAGALGFSAWIGRRTTRSITVPLTRLTATLANLRDGDIAARVVPDGPSEIRAVAASLNELAVENQQLTEQRRRRAEFDLRVRDMTASLHEHLDVGVVLSRAVEEVGAVLGAAWTGVVTTPDRGAPEVVASAGVVPGDAIAPDRLETALRAPPWSKEQACDDDRSAGPDGSALLAMPLDSDHGLALVVAGRASDHQDATALAVLARVVDVALRNAALYEVQERLVDKLRALDDDKSAFVSTVSHELRTPLTSIVGYVEMLADGDAGDLTAPQAELLDVVERNGRRLLTLIEDLLVLSRIESGTFRLERGPVDLGGVVVGLVAELGPRFAAAGLALRADVEKGMPPCDGDAGQVERVVLNLLTNAEKFTPPGGEVTVAVKRVGADVDLRVADTGIGIPTAEQDRLFTRFFRSSVAQQRSIKGTGLGLSIARSIVVEHGGDIAVDSREGVGTTVRVTLPLRLEVPAP